ncbi:MAG: stage III sporulation protein AG [Hespellia sp.]|nr:stage III sporulation protein AG [Hespellia sp.]
MNLKDIKWVPKKNQMVLLLLFGILLVVIAIPTGDSTKGDNVSGNQAKSSEAEDASDWSSYEKNLEEKLQSTLEQMDGVGAVTVMITLKSSEENVVASDRQSSSSVTTQEADGQSQSTTENTTDTTGIYSQNTDGSQTPYVSKQLTPKIEGVVVLAEGGDNGVVVENITEAVQALFGVEVHKIKVVKRSSS